MEYRYRSDYEKIISYQDREFPYLSKKKFLEYYPKEQGGYRILGSIGKKKGKEAGEFLADGITYPYQEAKYHKWSYGVEGYIEVGDDAYLAVLKSRTLRHLLLLFFTLALLLLIGTGVYNYFQQHGPKIDSGAGSYKAPLKVSKDYDPTRILIPGYGDIKLKADTNTAYVALWNPDVNPCYFRFAIVEEESGNIIYQSDLVPPGYAIKKVTFKKKIKKGIHPITVRISTFELEDFEKPMNGGEVKTNLVGLEE